MGVWRKGWRRKERREIRDGLDQSKPDMGRKSGEGRGNEGGNRGSWGWKREEIPELSISLPVLLEHANSCIVQPRPPLITATSSGVRAPGSLGH